jgi:ribosome-associated heat shock protein Hsp15
MKDSALPATSVRLDKWLWAARFFKTRSLASDAIGGGKVHYNGERIKPSKMVQAGAVLTIRQGDDEKTITVLNLVITRKNAADAQTRYTETIESKEQREQNTLTRKALRANLPPETKPNKKQRRQIHHFKQNADHHE